MNVYLYEDVDKSDKDKYLPVEGVDKSDKDEYLPGEGVDKSDKDEYLPGYREELTLLFGTSLVTEVYVFILQNLKGGGESENYKLNLFVSAKKYLIL